MQLDINQLIDKNLGLVWSRLKEMGLQHDVDAYSFGLEGLYKAVIAYDPNNGAAFSTYARVCISNNIGDYLRRLNKNKDIKFCSYNSLINEEGNVERIDLLASDIDIENDYIRREQAAYAYELCAAAVSQTPKTTQERIIKIWFDSKFTITQDEIANILGITQVYVGQVINKFLKTIKKRME